MSRQGTDAYRTVRSASLIENKSPHELTLMLFDGALGHLNAARGLVSNGDAGRARAVIDKVLAIVMELQGSLRDPETNEISANLFRLYDFVIAQLLEAGRGAGDEPMRLAHEILDTLRDAWVGITPVRAEAA